MGLSAFAASLLVASVQALQLPAGAVFAPDAASARACSPVMKHNDYFLRLARAETGRLRLCVTRSNNHIYGQVIDDAKGHVVAAASTMEKDAREQPGNNVGAAAAVGKRLGAKALEKGITKVHFDRKSYPYHGRVKALADGAREAGLDF